VAPVRPGFALALMLAAAGCGDPLMSGDYGGEPKLTLTGQFVGGFPGAPPNDPSIRGALFWNPGGTAPPSSFDQLEEQWGSGLPLPFPGTIDWRVYELPGPEYLAAVPGGAAYAMGVPLVYGDTNGDLLRNPEEPVIALPEAMALLYAPHALAAGDSPTGIAIPEGFSLVTAPLRCGRSPPPPPDGDCGVALGAPCQVDADCGGAGVCLRGPPWPIPEGLCAVPEPSLDGCRPRGGALAVDPRDPARAFWVQACRAHEDCFRPPPFQCDFAFGACLPSNHLRFKGDDQVRQAPAFCAPAG
jgi:hypothetical protein